MPRYAEPIETTELCYYMCGQIARFKNKSGNLMCCERHQKCPAIKLKNGVSVKKSYQTVRIPAKDLYAKMPQESKNNMAWNRGNITADFKYEGRGNHKGVLLRERGHKCQQCNLTEWQGQPITIELEHVDGDNRNNIRENLKLLCPNCHSQTITWKGKNSVKKKLKQYVSDEELWQALSNTKNIRQALLSVGLTGKGGNYKRAYELLYGSVAEVADAAASKAVDRNSRTGSTPVTPTN